MINLHNIQSTTELDKAATWWFRSSHDKELAIERGRKWSKDDQAYVIKQYHKYAALGQIEKKYL